MGKGGNNLYQVIGEKYVGKNGKNACNVPDGEELPKVQFS